MDKVASYLDVIPLPALGAGAIFGLVILLLIPTKHRLYVTIAAMGPWLALGQLVELGTAQAIAKATTALAFGTVAFAAALHPGPRSKLPASAWAYLLMGVLSIAFVLTVRDFWLAIALRIQWIALVLAALMVVRTIDTRQAFERVIGAITVAVCLGMLLAASDLARDPLSVWSKFGRLEPYGSSANQIGVLFASAVPFAGYSALRARTRPRRLAALSCAVLALGLVVLTASRSSLVVALVPLVPLLLFSFKRPLYLAVALGSGIIALNFLFTSTQARLDRLESLDTERTEILREYLERSVSQRPYLGLLETSGYSALLDDDAVGQHPHNAYIEMLYVGGIAYALPMFALLALVVVCTFTVFRLRRYLDLDRALLFALLALMMAILAHGFVNGAIFYANAVWAWLHVFLAVWFLTTARVLQGEARAAGASAARHPVPTLTRRTAR